MRRFLCALIALAIFASVDTAFAKKPKNKKPPVKKQVDPATDAQTEAAVIKKVDAEQGVVTVTTKPGNGEEGKDLEIAIDGSTKVAIDGEEKQGKEGLKNEKLKEGAPVKLAKDKEGKIVAILLGETKKKEPVNPEEARKQLEEARKQLEEAQKQLREEKKN